MAESTPLSYGSGTVPSNREGDTGGVSSMMTKENATAAANYVKDQAERLRRMATEGNMSIRVFAFLGGVAMVITSLMGLFGRIVTLRLISTLIGVYTLLFGLVICALEGKSFAIPERFSEKIRKYAMFLEYLWGRGCLYFFAGSLQLSQWHVVDIAVGGFMCFIGIAYVFTGRSTAQKLSEMRKSIFSEEMLKEKFDHADIAHTGQLNMEQFKVLTDSLGLGLSKNELHSAFSHIDKSGTGEITFNEFRHWWANWDFDSVDDAQLEV